MFWMFVWDCQVEIFFYQLSKVTWRRKGRRVVERSSYITSIY